MHRSGSSLARHSFLLGSVEEFMATQLMEHMREEIEMPNSKPEDYSGAGCIPTATHARI